MKRLLRRSEVERRTAMSRSSIYERMSKGTFPRPITVGPRAVRWVEEEIEAWIESRAAERKSA